MPLEYRDTKKLGIGAEALSVYANYLYIGYINREPNKKTYTFELYLRGPTRDRGTARSLEGAKKQIEKEWRLYLNVAGLKEK